MIPGVDVGLSALEGGVSIIACREVWEVQCLVDNVTDVVVNKHRLGSLIGWDAAGIADSDDLARVYRFDLAQDSEMISPTITILMSPGA